MKSLMVLGVACAVAALGTAQPATDEAKKLHGTWVVETTSREKELNNPWKGGQFVFAGDKVTVKLPNELDQLYTFAVDPAKMPKAMDFAATNQSAQRLWSIIYELDGDFLKLCMGMGVNRPGKFVDREGIIVVLKRKK